MIGFYAAGAMGSGGGSGTAWETLVASLSPIMWLRMSEASGSTIDASGNGNDGTVSASVTRSQPAIYGGMGLCMGFPSSGINSVSVADAPALSITGDLTVVIALKRNGTTPGTFPKLMWKPTDNPNGRANYGLVYNRSNGRIFFRVNASSSYYDASPSTALADTTPYLVAGRRSEDEVSCWLNGVKEAFTSLPSSGTVLDTSSSPIFIGGQSDNETDQWSGWLDEALLFNYALSDTELEDLYAARA